MMSEESTSPDPLELMGQYAAAANGRDLDGIGEALRAAGLAEAGP